MNLDVEDFFNVAYFPYRPKHRKLCLENKLFISCFENPIQKRDSEKYHNSSEFHKGEKTSTKIKSKRSPNIAEKLRGDLSYLKY